MEKLLIADDEESLRLLVSATLASEDYEILESGDGTEALAIARSERPRVVLLDVNMPGMNGLEVCRRIKGDPTLASVRVVMLSTASRADERAAGSGAGADAYLTKPFSPLELLTVIERTMALSSL